MSFRISDHHEARVRDLCLERGLVLERFGLGWRIYGDRVDLLVAKLGGVVDADLVPMTRTPLGIGYLPSPTRAFAGRLADVAPS